MKSIAFFLMMGLCGFVEAEEYYDYDNGNYIEITDGEIEAGSEVEYYDYDTSQYYYGEVSGVDSFGDVELIEYSTGRLRYLEAQ